MTPAALSLIFMVCDYAYPRRKRHTTLQTYKTVHILAQIKYYIKLYLFALRVRLRRASNTIIVKLRINESISQPAN